MESKLDKPSQKLPKNVRENLALVLAVAVNHQTRLEAQAYLQELKILSAMIKAKGLFNCTIKNNAALLKYQTALAKTFQQGISMGCEHKGTS